MSSLKSFKSFKHGLRHHNRNSVSWGKAIWSEKATKFYEPCTRILFEAINGMKKLGITKVVSNWETYGGFFVKTTSYRSPYMKILLYLKGSMPWIFVKRYGYLVRTDYFPFKAWTKEWNIDSPLLTEANCYPHLLGKLIDLAINHIDITFFLLFSVN